MLSNFELLPINIAGEWRLGGGAESATLYPATGEVVGRLRAPSLEDVDTPFAPAAGPRKSPMSARPCCTAWRS